ncbi:MAG: RNA polymerase factor sigma-54 [Succinivibrionaceae bacterium]|nr:RNA polymerase factor sigma-54 [Succinivibrionaceae bacterium]
MVSQGLFQTQKLSTGLVMTPQMQQAIRMLQMSTMELSQEIANEVEQNPLLEIDDEIRQEKPEDQQETRSDSDSGDAPDSDGGEAGEYGAASGDGSEIPEQDMYARTEDFGDGDGDTVSALESGSLPDDNDAPLDTTWEDTWGEGVTTVPRSSIHTLEADDDSPDYQGSTSETLQDHLLWQLNLSKFSPTDRAIARAVIDAVNDSGYLTESVEDLTVAAQNIILEERLRAENLDPDDVDVDALLASQEPIEPEEVVSVIHRVQMFDPVGVASASLPECMMVQLRSSYQDQLFYTEAMELLEHLWKQLETKDFRTIRRRMSLSESALKQVLALLQKLDPRPGARFVHDDSVYVKPDVIVAKRNNAWKVEMCRSYPRVRINRDYESLLSSSGSVEDRQYMTSHLSDAKNFIRSIEARQDTLRKVSECIVRHQSDFLEYGPEKMKPLIMKEIAEECEVSESSVSRVTTHKYMFTPQGLFELKYFFSSSLSGANGEDPSSATATQAKIRKIIAAEDKRKPISDLEICDLLQKEGIVVARRTVAKYRESMNIPASSKRKVL